MKQVLVERKNLKKENDMSKYNNNLSHFFLGEFTDNIGEIDYTILKVSYQTRNFIYSVRKNELDYFKRWIARVILNETDQYNKFLDGDLDVDELFKKVGLTISELQKLEFKLMEYFTCEFYKRVGYKPRTRRGINKVTGEPNKCPPECRVLRTHPFLKWGEGCRTAWTTRKHRLKQKSN